MEKISKYKIHGDSRFNYVLTTAPYGKYYIENESDVFDMVNSSKNTHSTLGLCEVYDNDKNQISIFDIDISLKEKVNITLDDLLPFLKVCHFVFNKYLKISKADIEGFVLTKHSFNNNIECKKDHLHFGVHIVYPNVILNIENKKKLYYLLLEEAKKKEVWKGLPLLHENYNYIIDETFTRRTPVAVYGSSKANSNYYRVRYTVKYNLDVEEISESESNADFEYYFKKFRYNTTREETDFDVNIMPSYVSPIPIEESPKVSSRKKNFSDVTEDLADVQKFVGILSTERAEFYDKWILVGLCLHNINASNEMLELFEKFSSGSETKKNRTNFKKIWKSFKKRKDGLNMGTLRYWASQDNPTEFYKIRNDEIDKKISMTIKDDGNTPYDIALVLKELYEDIYVCSNISKNIWYEFKNHRWNRMDSGFKLFLNISDQLVNYYKNKIKDIRRKEVELDDADLEDKNEKIEVYATKKKNIEKIIRMLKVTSFKKSLMEECRNLFYDPKFMENLDEISRHLLCFNNGVYDLDNLTFRDGTPQDYISYTTGVDYIEYTENNPEIEKVQSVLREMHDTREKSDYFLTTLSMSLHGSKKEQRIDFWTGTGSNGKSLTVDFLSKSLGDYFYSPSITILTVKRKSSSNPSPDIMKIKGRRVIVFQEPENDDQIYTGLMKSLFGNDMITGRYLHENEISFKPQASGFLACNDLPNISSQDGGTWRRIKVLHFPYKFVSYEPKLDFEKRGDPNLTEEIETLKEAFCSILVKYYKDNIILNGGKINEPSDVLDYTKQYRSSCDLYEEFTNEYIRTKSGSVLEFKSIYDALIHWGKGENISKGLPKKSDIKKQLENKYGKFINGKYWNDKELIYFN
jgi:P4 family phage/plasmid primase-like protien